jgi:hypothetical protein
MSQPKGAWEGLGGPVRMEDPNGSAWLDPSLDACCQRDAEDRARYGALKRTLDRFDVVAERERQRKHLVQLTSHVGCRCLYDPDVDGGEYTALIQLRAERPQEGSQEPASNKVTEVDTLRGDLVGEMKEGLEKGEAGADSDEDDEFDYLLDEDLPGQESEAVQAWQEARKIEMETSMLRQEVEEYHGYGKHRQFHPRRIFSVVGLVRTGREIAPPPPFVVLHLYDSESAASAWLDLYLESFSIKARGTLFVRAYGRGALVQKDSSPLQSQLKAQTDMPALVLLKDGVVVTVVPNLRGLLVDSPEESQPRVDRAALEAWLFRAGALDERSPPAYESLCRMRPEEEALMDSMRAPAQPVEESYYDCGMPGCKKTFSHQHVGVPTEQQTGMVVSEDKILGAATSG